MTLDNLLEALKYPYRKENLVPTLVIPGAFSVGYGILYLLLYFVLLIPLMLIAFAGAADSSGIVMSLGIVILVVGFLIMLAGLSTLYAPVMGYYWELAQTIREEGLDTPAPVWTGNLKTYWINGLKGTGFFWIFYLLPLIPVVIVAFASGGNDTVISLFHVLATLAQFLALPFLFAAFVQNMEEKSFAGFFRLDRILTVGARCYGPVMLMILISVLLWIPYAVVMVIALCTVIGVPFVVAAWQTTWVHLLTQGYEGYWEDPQIPGSSAKPPVPPPDPPPGNPPDTLF